MNTSARRKGEGRSLNGQAEEGGVSWDVRAACQPNTHNLELHRLALELDRPDLEVDANGAQVAVRERILRESQKQT